MLQLTTWLTLTVNYQLAEDLGKPTAVPGTEYRFYISLLYKLRSNS